MDTWVYRLKQGYDVGYYKTEAAEGAQTGFPWQNKVCKDCPFWTNGICRVFAEYRNSTTHTCSYFDPWNHAAADDILQQRQTQGSRRWWDWFNDHNSRGAAR